MQGIVAIAGHEIKRIFRSLLAWIIIAVVEFLAAVLFLVLLNQFLNPAPWLAGKGATEIVAAGLLQISGIIFLLVTPFITMRSFSEERRTGTIQLLYSSPVTLTELVLGKYLGIIVFLLALLFIVALMPISLSMGTSIDLMQLGSGLLGLFLLIAGFAAIGVFVSTLTSQPAIAAIVTFGILFMLWIINLAAGTGSETFRVIFTYLSPLNHFNNLIDGLLKSTDIIYYLIIIVTFIILSIWRLDAERINL